jgi:hypothetical protein
LCAEFGQQSISGVLDDPATVFSDLRLDNRAQMALEPDMRPFFVDAGQPAIASYIGREDSCEPSLYTLRAATCISALKANCSRPPAGARW